MNSQQQQQVFDTWLSRYRGLLFKIIHAHASTPHDREDLFQELAVQLWRSVPAFRGESAATTWIYRVALNTAMQWKRKERRHHKRKQAFIALQHTLAADETPPDPRLEQLYTEIARLAEADRALALMLLDGLSYREMAEVTGLTESHVGVKVHRLKNRLAQRLTPGGPREL